MFFYRLEGGVILKKTINAILSLIMVISVICMCCTFAYAEDSVENWSYDTSTNTLTISGIGETAGFVNGDKTHFYDVENLILEEGITSIGRDAFNKCSNLKNVQFPDSLKIIRTNAFRDTAIKEITIPKNVTEIHSDAFSTESLKTVNIYAEYVEFSSNVFYYSDIQRVNINNLSNWCAYDFSFASDHGNPVAWADLYLNGELITDLVIPDDVVTINDATFYSCFSIESVTISDSVKNIRTYAFNGCENLKSVYIPKNVSGIAYNAFSNCNNLTDIYYEGTKEEFNGLFTKTPAIPYVTIIHYLNDHEHNFEQINVVAPKCTATGYTKYKCTICGDTYRANITGKLEHNFTAQIIEPSCMEKGYTLYTCSMCGKETKADYVDVGKHNYSLDVISPTCTTEGINKYTCKICKDVVEEYTDPLPHFYKFDSHAGEFYRYSCVDCGRTTSKHENNMPELIDYVNTCVFRGNKNMYLDVVPDGIINAKDFAEIRHLSKYN